MTPATDDRAAIAVVRAADASVRVVAGGNHVTSELPGVVTGHVIDAITVRADPGGGPPPHRHDFGEWFLVHEGSLQITGMRNGRIQPVADLMAGDSVWVPPGVWHGTVNATDDPVRFLVIGVPGVMTGYFAQAGIPVPDDTTPPPAPPGPAELRQLAVGYGITFLESADGPDVTGAASAH